MANPPRLRGISRPSEDFKERLEQRTGINHWSRDSTARTLSDVMSASIVADRNQMVSAFEQIQISTAKGTSLDALAKTQGLTRFEPTRAYSGANERNFYFYVSTGTFGDINGGASISLPAGTLISPVGTGGSSIRYAVKHSYTLPSSGDLIYCAVEAVGVGSSLNVGPRTLTAHNLSAYPTLYCTNRYAVVNGRGRENDKDLRFRVSTNFRSLTINNTNALIMGALAVPGVLNVTISEGYYGMGTCGVFVFGSDGFSSPLLISQVERRLQQLSTAGLRVVVSAGVQVSFGFDIDLIVPQTPTRNQIARIKAGIKQSLRDYLSEGTIRKTVSLRDLRNKIMREVPELLSIVPRKRRTKFDMFSATYVSRKYATYRYGSENERLLVNTYSLLPEEYAVLGTVNLNIDVVS
jgi:uncharacterized phage protein gp47/JayE